MSERIDMTELARSVLRAPTKEKCPVCGTCILESDEVRALRAERDCLAERLRGTPEMREVIGELRVIHGKLASDRNARRWAIMRMADLLRRLDLES